MQMKGRGYLPLALGQNEVFALNERAKGQAGSGVLGPKLPPPSPLTSARCPCPWGGLLQSGVLRRGMAEGVGVGPC